MAQQWRFLAPRTLTFALAVAALVLAFLNAQPALAKENKAANNKDEKAAPAQNQNGDQNRALIGPAYTFEGSDILFLTNAGKATVRAVVTIRDLDGVLVGCGSGLLESGEADFLYIRRGPAPESALTVMVYGVKPNGSLSNSLEGQVGLAGNVTFVDASTGEPKGVIELLEVPTTPKDRRADVDECLRVGFDTSSASTGDGQSKNVLTGVQPARWSESSPQPGNNNNIVKISSTPPEKDKSKDEDEDKEEKDKGKRKDKDKDKDDEDDD